MKKIKIMACIALAVCCLLQGNTYSRAAEGETEGYTTIRINAKDDSSGPLQYAIDSDAPEAFGSSNEFRVEPGSEHTVYVKDASGNISAQVYRVPDAAMDVEVNIGYSDTSSMAMVTDEKREVIENGGGTVAEQVISDGSSTAERLFYTITTKEGHVFYMIIDRNGGTDNVYLLDQVTDSDLYALAMDEGTPAEQEKKSSVFDIADNSSTTETPAEAAGNANAGKEKSGGGDWFFILILILLGAAAFYYYKIYKPKQEQRKNASDAMDLDEFEAEDEKDGNDVLDFAVSAEEREAELDAIINGSDFEDEANLPDEEDFLNYDPEQDMTDSEMEPENAGEPEETEQLEFEEAEDDE